jgi:uncharacterized damage-inducible protein DinB
MNAHLQASLDAFDEMFEQMTRFVAPLSDDVVNWRPPVTDANTIAALVTHTCGSTNTWLSRAVGETIQRDRDAEFRRAGGTAELVAQLEQTRAEVRRRINLMDGRDLAHTITVTRAGGAHAGTVMDVSLAWCLEHALVHAGEHWGHIQLTQQLHAARP